ncbi:MAG TPA: uracil permease [Acholeplasmataceae bacterium]|nr:uracil permease [Acholeplasmataceae bacterium]
MNQRMILGAKDRPKTGKWFLLSFQHVFAMFGATILVPILTGLPISVALFTSGVGTLIYIVCTRAKVPVYLGSSFAYITPIIAVSGFNPELGIAGSYGAVLTGLFTVGIVYIIIAVVIKFAGTKWINVVFPPIIIGPMIAIIGFGLSGSAVSNAGLISGGDWKVMLVALVSVLIVAFVAIKAKGFFKIIPFLSGIVGGYILGAALGLIDFAPVIAVLKAPAQWFGLPEFIFLGFKDASYVVGSSTITVAKISFAALMTILPLAFVTACEHIGDHAVLSEITGEDYLQDPGLHRTMLGDGIATAFAALFGGPANTTYGENTSVVGMTRVGSVWVTGLAAVIAICLSFINVFIAVINTIPLAVMGGICIILYGFIGMNGIKVLINSKVDLNKTRNMIIASAMLVIGLGGAVIGITNETINFTLSGMSLAAVVGVLLNLILPRKESEVIHSEDLKIETETSDSEKIETGE